MVRRRVPTSHDVARLAGVSRGTVSAVLNGTRSPIRTSEETRQRVLTAATELSYSPHPIAQALRRQRSRIIGFVPRRERRTPYEEPVSYLLGINLRHAAMRHGYHLIEANAVLARSHGSEELARFLLSQRVEGVVLEAPDNAEAVQHFAEHGLPIVQLLRPQIAAPTSTVTVDPAPGITAAVDHLVYLGHQAIAFIGSGAQHPIDRARLDSFMTALARYQLGCHTGHVRCGQAYSIEEGRALAQALLKIQERPTAILVAGDNLVLGTLQTLYEAGVRVPDQMSLVSYDDTFAGHLPPPLTSVAQPLEAVCEHAMLLIANLLDRSEDSGEPVHIVLPTHLVVRESTWPLQ